MHVLFGEVLFITILPPFPVVTLGAIILPQQSRANYSLGSIEDDTLFYW